ncbi:prephenate dehydrogenase [Vallitalea longa]|uniref:Prephenate dehydrogenase n=1 Tax=Vallitalea longa TaxID=2936439 RepID=A0A9W5YFP9_9FIRM|nr:prephenate dehydrogenase [Vallitalea longa]GKX31074.1 prephenate dehydrogenase [Vallitalea longa]
MNIQKVGFIGLGLIGGSLAKAIKDHYENSKIIAYDIKITSLEKAMKENIIDQYTTEINNNFRDCQIIFLCAPVENNIHAMNKLLPIINNNCIITDVSSTKEKIITAALDMNCNNFIGGHPMTGSEKSGISAADRHLFENAYYILTPLPDTSKDKIDILQIFITELGALPVVIEPSEHDFVTATISHVPHVIASTLVNVVSKLDTPDKHMHTLAAGGFKDITRIASSSPAMWQQICLTNNKQIIKVIDKFQQELNMIKENICNCDSEAIHSFFSLSRDYRNTFSDKNTGFIMKSYKITVDVIDKPGIIAEIASLLSKNNINIKNIGINNNREHQQGVLEIIFYDIDSQNESIKLLTNMNYNIYI